MKLTDDILDEALLSMTDRVSGKMQPKYICLYSYSGDLLDFEDHIFNVLDKESVHISVDTDGTITQYAPFTSKTWHAGAASWQGYHGLNGFAIGVYVIVDEKGGYSANTLDALVRLLVDTYKIRDIVSIKRPFSGIVDIEPYKPYVEYGNADSMGRYVVISGSEVFSGPSTSFTSITVVEPGEAVKLLKTSRDQEWALILFEQRDNVSKQGWLHESMLRRL
jgi:hypothetical protein